MLLQCVKHIISGISGIQKSLFLHIRMKRELESGMGAILENQESGNQRSVRGKHDNGLGQAYSVSFENGSQLNKEFVPIDSSSPLPSPIKHGVQPAMIKAREGRVLMPDNSINPPNLTILDNMRKRSAADLSDPDLEIVACMPRNKIRDFQVDSFISNSLF